MMIVKEENWDMNPHAKAVRDFFVDNLFNDRIEPTIFLGRKENIKLERMREDILRIVDTWMQDVYNLDEKNTYFYNDVNVRSSYIFTIDFLPTGGTLTSLIVKFKGMVEPVRLDVMY